MLRRGRLALIATGSAAAIAAMLLIPGREGAAVADTAAPVVTSFTSRETIAAIDALLGPSEEAPRQVATTQLPSGINPSPPAADARLQTAALTTPAAPTTDLEGAPLADPNLRPDRIGRSAVNLRAGPSSDTATIGVLQPGQAVQTGESDGGWVEVTLPDGTTGWVFSRYLASVAAAAPAPSDTAATAERPARTTAKADSSAKADAGPAPKATIQGKGKGKLEGRMARIDSSLKARDKPNGGARTVFQTEPGERVRILDVRGNWLRILTADGSSGWIEAG